MLERYSIGVDIDQTGINSGTEQMISTLNNATTKMKESMTQMADSLKASMAGISSSLVSVSEKELSNTSNSFKTMGASISESTKQASSTLQQSTQQMTSSLNALQASISGLNLKSMAADAENASSSSRNLGESLKNAGDNTSFFADKARMLKQHFEWILTGGLLGAIVGIPAAMLNAASSTETLTQKTRQNLELADQYHGNNQLLESDLKRLSETASAFAVGYGADLTEVMDSMQILSRRFKDVESISYLTSAALTMNKLDFVDLKKASSDLESVILQFGLTAKGTQGFINDFSVAVHTARITGTDLLDALQRSGSSFKEFNMGSREAIAAVSALSTETARSGSTIGNTMKSITANFSMDKAVKALKSYDIQLYDTNENGMKVLRAGTNVFQELQTLYAKLDDEGKSKLSLSIAGGKFQVNAMSAFLADANQNFSKILGEMNNKSSDSLTNQLLAAGMDTFKVKMESFKASLQVFAKTMGDQVLPNLKKMMDYLTAGTMYFQQHSAQIATTVQVLAGLAAAYGIVRLAALTYQGALALVSIYTGLQAIATAALTGTIELATVGTWAQNYANIAATTSSIAAIAATDGLAAAFRALWVATGPAGWVVLAIIALGVAIYEIYNNWGPILEWMKDSWNKVVGVVSDNIAILAILFPEIAIAIYVIKEYWTPTINFIKNLWNIFISFMVQVGEIFVKVIDSICTAVPKFTSSIGEALTNIDSQLSNWAYSFLPQWGQDVITFFGNLGSKLNAITKSIGDSIRANLTIGTDPSVGDFKKGEYGAGTDGSSSETPLEKAQRLAQEALASAMAGGKSLGEGMGGGGDEPSMGNQLGGGGKAHKDKKTSESETEYAIAKREYEAEVSDEELTAAQKLEIYKNLLDGKAASEKEEHDYAKGLGKLEVQDVKEQRAIKNAELDLEIAEGKQKNADYYRQKVALLKEEVENCKEGSLERIQAEIKVANAKHDLLDQTIKESSAQIDKEKADALANLATQKDANAKALSDYQMTQKEHDKLALQSENTRYGIELDALNKKKALYVQEPVEAEKVQKEIDTLTKEHMKTRLNLEKTMYNEEHAYQIAGLNGLKSGLQSSLDSIRDWNKSAANIIKDFANTVYKSFADVWIKGVVENASKGFARMMGLSNTNKTKETTLEQQKQTALTNITAAGEKSREIAVKTSIASATTAGASGAQAMVSMTQAAFTATLTMIQATAASIATILPAGPALAAAITTGVATSTATLAAAATAATASISSLSVASFDVGSWSVDKDQLAQIHEGETIIPKQPAQQFRDYVAGNDLSGVFGSNNNSQQSTGGNTTIHLNASAVDTKNLKSVVSGLGKELVSTLNKQNRNYNTGKTVNQGGW